MRAGDDLDKQAARTASQHSEAACSNCGASVPRARLAMHEAYCSRHMWVCPLCSVMLRRGSAKEASHGHCSECDAIVAPDAASQSRHAAAMHRPIQCDCDEVLSDYQAMVLHRHPDHGTCVLRLHMCRFCHDVKAAGRTPADALDRRNGFTGHEAGCGNRTEQCPGCRQRCRLKDFPAHCVLSPSCKAVIERGEMAPVGAPDLERASSGAAHASHGMQPPPSIAPSTWDCPYCTIKNPAGSSTCDVCGQARELGAAGSRRDVPTKRRVKLVRRIRCRNLTCANFVESTQATGGAVAAGGGMSDSVESE